MNGCLRYWTIILFVARTACAFCHYFRRPIPKAPFPVSSSSSYSVKHEPFTLTAQVFDWNGENEGNSGRNDWMRQDEGVTTLSERLSADRDRTASFARLAVAFSPDDQSRPSLDDIMDVHIVSVDESHIEIGAVSCIDDSCVSFLVPLTFPQSCQYSYGELMEECVLENLAMLDEAAGFKIQEIESRKGFEEISGELMLPLLHEEFPSWWVDPNQIDNSAELFPEDCHDVARLMNENEFQPEVDALASRALQFLDGGEKFQIHRAKVAAVGPAGMCFRAVADSNYDKGGDLRIIRVPYAFGGEIQDKYTLRQTVLGAVANAMPRP